LNIIRARAYPKATEHITDIEDMIQKLVDRGHAYIENSSVYFKVSSFPTYGQLANVKFEEMIDGAGDGGPNARRGGSDEKQSNRDFALWKAVTTQDGDVQWDTGFGRGRPGTVQ
jgi:cysteinyl-tRNA synthetase